MRLENAEGISQRIIINIFECNYRILRVNYLKKPTSA